MEEEDSRNQTISNEEGLGTEGVPQTENVMEGENVFFLDEHFNKAFEVIVAQPHVQNQKIPLETHFNGNFPIEGIQEIEFEIGVEMEVMANEEIVTSSSSTIRQIYDIFKPLCDSVNLVSEFKTSGADNSDYIKIHDPKADKHFKYFPSLHLVVFLQDGHLFLRLFLGHKKVFKESVLHSSY